jgi:hypothetical protein
MKAPSRVRQWDWSRALGAERAMGSFDLLSAHRPLGTLTERKVAP